MARTHIFAADAVSYDVAPGVAAALESFVLPDTLGFGRVAAPVMFSAEWWDGAWGPRADAKPNLFRPRENWQRLKRSAERLSMPSVPERLFFEAIDALVGSCHRLIGRPIPSAGRARWRR